MNGADEQAERELGWRESLLRRLLATVPWLCVAALAMALWGTHGRNRAALATLVPFVVLSILAWLRPSWSFGVRVLSLVLPLLAGTFIAYLMGGFWTNASLIGAASVVLVGLLLGRGAMLWLIAVLLLAPVGAALGMLSGRLRPDLADMALTSAYPWVRTTFVTLSCWTVLGLAVTFVVQRIEAALWSKSDALERLREQEERRLRAEAERGETERAALGAQKMELVGRLAAGAAHDFNNVLSVLSTWGALLAEANLSDAERSEAKAALDSSIQHGVALTRQLLSLARTDCRTLVRLRLDGAVRRGVTDLSRMVRANMRLACSTTPLVEIEADELEVQQVLINLVLNARDAMPEGGVIEVSCGCETVLGELSVIDGTLPAGRWAFVRVRDSGTGIEPALRERIFQLFFTTKPVGEGTGLGLATVQRIARLGGGGVTLESQPGVGSTFTVFLARALDSAGRLLAPGLRDELVGREASRLPGPTEN